MRLFTPGTWVGSKLSPKQSAGLAFLIVFSASLVVALIQGHKFFYYDSGVYWLLSSTFSDHGHFSLLNFENTGLRGYALPLTYFALDKIGGVFTSDETVLVMIFNASIVAAIGAFLAPRFSQVAWPRLHWGLARRLVLGGLILVFWSGYLNYPLSDFPALAAALMALMAISSLNSPVWMLIAGGSAAYAMNARPAYLLLIPMLFVLVFWGWFEERNAEHAGPGRRALCLCLFVTGLALVSIPQSIVQHHAFNSYNPIPGGSGLAGFQYTAGLELQRYETYIGNELQAPRMEYVDPHTAEILDGLDDRKVSGTPEYAEIVLSHPLTMAGVFLRHIVNGLDQRYTTPYIEDLKFPLQRPLRLAGFLLVFLALLRIAWPAARRSLEPARWRYPVALALTCATSIPSAVETRFLLPIFMLSSLLVLAPGWPNPIGATELGLRRYRTLALTIVAGVAFFAVALAIVDQTSTNLHFG